MDKILVEVYIPVMGRSYDIFIPVEERMNVVLELIKKAVSDLSDNTFKADEQTAICYREEGTIVNINLSVNELGLKNGSKLMLI